MTVKNNSTFRGFQRKWLFPLDSPMGIRNSSHSWRIAGNLLPQKTAFRVCCVMLCSVVLCWVGLGCVVLCCVVLCCVVLCCVVLCCVVLCCVVLCCVVLSCVVLSCIVLCCVVCVVLCVMCCVVCCVVLCCGVLCCLVLSCLVLCCLLVVNLLWWRYSYLVVIGFAAVRPIAFFVLLLGRYFFLYHYCCLLDIFLTHRTQTARQSSGTVSILNAAFGGRGGKYSAPTTRYWLYTAGRTGMLLGFALHLCYFFFFFFSFFL